MSGPPNGWMITLRDPAGGGEVRVTERDGALVVDPPEAAQTGFVAAAVARMQGSRRRIRARAACVAGPPRGRPPTGESHPFG